MTDSLVKMNDLAIQISASNIYRLNEKVKLNIWNMKLLKIGEK